MKRRTALLVVTCGLIIGGTLETAQARRRGRVAKKPAPVPVLTDTEIADLLFMREEEKLARDVYITFYKEYGLRVFNNIPKAEQRHMNAVLSLLNTYGLQDPILDFGKFANTELQELYDTLVATGMKSKLDALKVGALIEEVDMEDLVDAIDRTTQTNIKRVYSNLLRGSTYHLKAFVWNIENLTGETYEAQWITQEEVDDILGR